MGAPAKVSGISIRREDGDGKTIFRLEGRFDPSAAAVLRRVVEHLPPESVLLDFSHVHHFMDLAVPELTRDLEGRRISIVGLPSHQQRLFRYFGWCEPEQDNPVYYVPEKVAS